VEEALMKTPVQPVAADLMAEASEKPPLNKRAPAAASGCDEVDVLVSGEEGVGNSAALGAGCAGYEKGLGLG
jgi:hypothetical protein